MAQPLDPSQTYLIPASTRAASGLSRDLDRGDLLALRHRLKAVLKSAPYRWMETDDKLDKRVAGYDDVHLHRSSFQTRQLPSQPAAENLYVIIAQEAGEDHPSLRIAMADRPGEKAVSFREPILTDRSNAIPANTEGEHIAPVLERWLDLLDRPLFDPLTELADTRRLVHQTASELLAHEAQVRREDLTFAISFDAGKPYKAPNLWYGMITGLAIAPKALTPAAADIFATLIPGLVELQKDENKNGITYSFAPTMLFDEQHLAECTSVIDSMKALKPFAHLDRCLSDDLHKWKRS